MKISDRTVNDLLNLVGHARRDISYREGGSYGDGDDFDKKAIKSSERAIDFIKEIILQRD
jgi:hypothetical protein